MYDDGDGELFRAGPWGNCRGTSDAVYGSRRTARGGDLAQHGTFGRSARRQVPGAASGSAAAYFGVRWMAPDNDVRCIEIAVNLAMLWQEHQGVAGIGACDVAMAAPLMCADSGMFPAADVRAAALMARW